MGHELLLATTWFTCFILENMEDGRRSGFGSAWAFYCTSFHVSQLQENQVSSNRKSNTSISLKRFSFLMKLSRQLVKGARRENEGLLPLGCCPGCRMAWGSRSLCSRWSFRPLDQPHSPADSRLQSRDHSLVRWELSWWAQIRKDKIVLY